MAHPGNCNNYGSWAVGWMVHHPRFVPPRSEWHCSGSSDTRQTLARRIQTVPCHCKITLGGANRLAFIRIRTAEGWRCSADGPNEPDNGPDAALDRGEPSPVAIREGCDAHRWHGRDAVWSLRTGRERSREAMATALARISVAPACPRRYECTRFVHGGCSYPGVLIYQQADRYPGDSQGARQEGGDARLSANYHAVCS